MSIKLVGKEHIVVFSEWFKALDFAYSQTVIKNKMTKDITKEDLSIIADNIIHSIDVTETSSGKEIYRVDVNKFFSLHTQEAS